MECGYPVVSVFAVKQGPDPDKRNLPGQVRGGCQTPRFLTFKDMAHFFCALAESLLKPADKLVVFSFGVLQVIVG